MSPRIIMSEAIDGEKIMTGFIRFQRTPMRKSSEALTWVKK